MYVLVSIHVGRRRKLHRTEKEFTAGMFVRRFVSRGLLGVVCATAVAELTVGATSDVARSPAQCWGWNAGPKPTVLGGAHQATLIQAISGDVDAPQRRKVDWESIQRPIIVGSLCVWVVSLSGLPVADPIAELWVRVACMPQVWLGRPGRESHPWRLGFATSSLPR